MGPRSKLAWTLGALLAGLGLAEIVARSHKAVVPRKPQATGAVIRVSSDPELVTENLPGGEQSVVYTDPDGTRAHRVVAHVNAQGWRGRPLAPVRESGVLRIAAVGDSHTFGQGVNDDETWPAVLEHELGAAGTRVEVLNAGVNGYGADQVFALLEKRVLGYAPDLVLYGFFCNDVALPLSGPEAGSELVAPAGGPGWWRTHSRLIDLLAEALERRGRLSNWARAQERIYADDSPAWAHMQAELVRVRARVESGGARFAVLLFPLFVPAPSSGLVSSAAHRKLRACCAAQGIPCLDLEPLFEGQDLDALRVHPLDMHAGTQAQRMAGAELARWVRAEDLLRPAERR